MRNILNASYYVHTTHTAVVVKRFARFQAQQLTYIRVCGLQTRKGTFKNYMTKSYFDNKGLQ